MESRFFQRSVCLGVLFFVLRVSVFTLPSKENQNLLSACISGKTSVIPESSLLGISLYDSVQKVMAKFKSPNEVYAVKDSSKSKSGKELDLESEDSEENIEASSPKNTFVEYSRYVYQKERYKLSFILNKCSQVVQIEAFGNDSRVQTKRHVCLGDPCAKIIAKYGPPELQFIQEDQFVLSYPSRQLAFRLSKLDKHQPYKIVAIVVSAGKIDGA